MFKPVPLNLPPYPFKITLKDNGHYIFDEIRKKHLFLTPEEWVRQHFIKFLINQKKAPATLIQIEGGLKLNQTSKRSDILIYNNSGEKMMLVECKAPHVNITQATFDQASRYNMVHKVKWLVVTNGLAHYFAKIDHQQNAFSFVAELPNFAEL